MGKKNRRITCRKENQRRHGAETNKKWAASMTDDRDVRQRQVEISEDRLELGHDKIEDKPADTLHAQHEHEDVSQPRSDARPDRKLARARFRGGPQCLGKQAGGLPHPGQQNRVARDESCAPLRVRLEESRPSSSGRPGA